MLSEPGPRSSACSALGSRRTRFRAPRDDARSTPALRAETAQKTQSSTSSERQIVMTRLQWAWPSLCKPSRRQKGRHGSVQSASVLHS